MSEKSPYEEFVTINTLEDWMRREVVERNEWYIQDHLLDAKDRFRLDEANSLIPNFLKFKKQPEISYEETQILLKNKNVIEKQEKVKRKENWKELGMRALAGICAMNCYLPAFNPTQALYFSQNYKEKQEIEE